MGVGGWKVARRVGLVLMALAAAGAGWFVWSVMGLSPFENHLAHPPGLVTAPLGATPPAVEEGDGPLDVVLVSGIGYGTTPWDRFMSDFGASYRMLAAPLPGFGGSPPPPLPASDASYGDLPWTRGAARGLAELVRERGLDRPVVVGFFSGGAHAALHLALDSPELVRGVVVVGADAYRPLQSSFGGRPLSYRERVRSIDRIWGPWIFGRMRPDYFRDHVFPASVYAHDTAVAAALVRESREAPMPTFVQYVAEHMASDVRRDLPTLDVPVIVLQPSFDAEARAASPGLDLVFDTWGEVDTLPLLEVRHVEGVRAAVMVDRPEALDAAIRDVASESRGVVARR